MLLTMVAIFFLGLSKAPNVAAAEPMKFTLISGSVGGGWYTQSGIISQIIKRSLPPGSTVTVVPGTGIANVLSINRGDGQIAYTFTAWAGWAATGTGPFKTPQKNIRAVATLDQNFVNIVARGDLPINSLREVKAKKFPLKLTMQRPVAESGAVISRYLFAEYGWGPPDAPFFRNLIKWGGSLRIVSSHGEAAGLIRDGHADMWVVASSFNHPPVVELESARKIKFIPVDQDVLKVMKEKYNLPTFVVPAKSFKYMDKPTPLIGVKTILTTNSMQPDDLIYTITKALAEGKEEMCKAVKRLCAYDPKNAWENTGYELHPGAARYYKEKGYMK